MNKFHIFVSNNRENHKTMILFSIYVAAAILAIIVLTSRLKVNAFASLFIVSFILALLTIPFDSILSTMKTGFGNTMASISFIIIFGATIAVILEKTGGAFSIANYIFSKTGKSKAPLATALTGFIPGLTIFCDTGFIILSGVAKTFSARSKVAMPMIAAILGCSLYSVHCLIPTHPGALAAAEALNVNIGYMILAGFLFAVPATAIACLYIKYMVKGKNYPPSTVEVEKMDTSRLPSVGISLLPVLLPILLIAISSLIKSLYPGSLSGAITAIYFVGEPNIALFIGVLCAFVLLWKSKIKASFSEVIESAITKSGVILIITAAGGMFGLIIKETGVAGELGNILGRANIGLFVPFIISVVLKTAQGSSTIAIITTAAIIEPMLVSLGFDTASGRLFATLAMGAGSMVASHANDSYFWVITKFSEIEADVSLKVYSSATIVMGVSSFLFIWLFSMLI